MQKVISFVVAAIIIVLTGCTFHITKDITERLQPAELYELYEVKPANLKIRSKCPLPPTINIVNMETRVEDYDFSAPHTAGNVTLNPKELTSAIVEYLKYGFERSQIKVDSNSSKIIHVSFKDVNLLRGFFRIGSNIKMNVNIPETKYSEIYEAKDWAPSTFFTAAAYAIHDVTRKIIDDPVIQDYILCKAEYTDKSLSQKLQELQTALDNGFITKEEYQLKRKVLLEKY